MLEQEEKEKVAFDSRISEDLEDVKGIIKARRKLEVEKKAFETKAFETNQNNVSESVQGSESTDADKVSSGGGILDYVDINSSKPSLVTDSPFQFIEEDPLIACVGTNG